MPEALPIFDCDGVPRQMRAERGVIGASMPACPARVGELPGGPPPEDFEGRFGG